MPTNPKPKDEETKKKEDPPSKQKGKQNEEFHNFLIVDHSLRPQGFHS